MTGTALGRARRVSAWVLTPFVAVLLIVFPASAASAHPLDLTWQTSYVTPAAGTVEVEIKISVGVLVAPAFLADLDRDADHSFSGAEGDAYASRVLAKVALRIDGTAVPLSLTQVELPDYPQTQAGYGVLRVKASGAAPATGTHTLFYRNDFVAEKPRYQVAVAGASISVGTQHRDEAQQQVETDYTVTAAGSAAQAPGPDDATGAWGVDRLIAAMRDPARSLWVTVVAIGLAMALGAFHALTPGHGKTIMTAYLVGTGGRVRDALALGASVTVTHTSSVLVIGVLALVANRFIVPSVLVPSLEVVAGILVLGLGLRLLWQRRGALARPRPTTPPDHDHAHDHDHDHAHDHGHGHDHGEHGHSHGLLWEPCRPLSMGAVLALGASGGLVPCPEALGVLILAVGLGQIPIGLALILSFSVGLAAVLIAIGVLLVRVRSMAAMSQRFRGRSAERWLRLLPVVSALVVVLLGAGLIARTVTGLA